MRTQRNKIGNELAKQYNNVFKDIDKYREDLSKYLDKGADVLDLLIALK